MERLKFYYYVHGHTILGLIEAAGLIIALLLMR